MRVILVSGSRNMHRTAMLNAVLAKLSPDLIVHGDARGCDTLAKEWAESNNVPHIAMPAQWDAQGKGAGPRRNLDMLALVLKLQQYGHEVIVIAFPEPGSIGTRHLIGIAKKAGLEVKDFIP